MTGVGSPLQADGAQWLILFRYNCLVKSTYSYTFILLDIRGFRHNCTQDTHPTAIMKMHDAADRRHEVSV